VLLALTLGSVLSCTGVTTETKSRLSECTVFKPISFSASGDTEETIEEIIEHNSVFESVCIKPND
jgi:hypothetical protein